jgi:hypothetical protein
MDLGLTFDVLVEVHQFLVFVKIVLYEGVPL